MMNRSSRNYGGEAIFIGPQQALLLTVPQHHHRRSSQEIHSAEDIPPYNGGASMYQFLDRDSAGAETTCGTCAGVAADTECASIGTILARKAMYHQLMATQEVASVTDQRVEQSLRCADVEQGKWLDEDPGLSTLQRIVGNGSAR